MPDFEEEDEIIEQKSLYQIYMVRKDNDQVIGDYKVIALNEKEALNTVGLRQRLIALNLNHDGTDLFIRVAGYLATDGAKIKLLEV